MDGGSEVPPVPSSETVMVAAIAARVADNPWHPDARLTKRSILIERIPVPSVVVRKVYVKTIIVSTGKMDAAIGRGLFEGSGEGGGDGVGGAGEDAAVVG